MFGRLFLHDQNLIRKMKCTRKHYVDISGNYQEVSFLLGKLKREFYIYPLSIYISVSIPYRHHILIQSLFKAIQHCFKLDVFKQALKGSVLRQQGSQSRWKCKHKQQAPWPCQRANDQTALPDSEVTLMFLLPTDFQPGFLFFLSEKLTISLSP